jgi:hypothetical protein
MSTNGAVGFRLNNEDKISYNHCDSYPDGLGVDVVEFILKNIDNIEKLKQKVSKIKLVQKTDTPTEKIIKKLEKYSNFTVGDLSRYDWYGLLREAQGDLNAYCKGGYMLDNKDFIKDSLFCEYAYVVNLDENVLECYLGWQKTPDGKSRYQCEKPSPEGYYHCKLLKSIPFDKLSTKKLLNIYKK